MTPEKHAKQCAPQESCGFFIGKKYIPCQNAADDPLNNFRIAPGEWRAEAEMLVHSHPDGSRYLSAADRYHQHHSGLPWMLIAGGKRYVYRYAPLLRGREFVYGKSDCYTLARDAYMLAGIELGDYPRSDIDADMRAEMFLANIEKEGFARTDAPQAGDLVLSNLMGYANHIGVYIGNERILHHPARQLSRVEDIGRAWQRCLHGFWRHPGMTAEGVQAILNDLENHPW